jgi:hypothetical protein
MFVTDMLVKADSSAGMITKQDRRRSSVASAIKTVNIDSFPERLPWESVLPV